MAMREPVRVNSYRAVLDDVERRIYRVDRWRLPLPGGIEVRAILYTVGAFVALAAAGNLPGLGALLGQLPPGLRYMALPVLCGWGLSVWRVDGRAPHHALVGAARYMWRAKTLAGLRPAAGVGHAFAPVAGLRVAATGEEPVYRPGRVRGPASLTLRYPARIEVLRAGGGDDPFANARRVGITALTGHTRPLARGQVIDVPDGVEVRLG